MRGQKIFWERGGTGEPLMKPCHFFGIFVLGFTKKSQQPSTCSNNIAQSNSTAKFGQTMIEDFQIPALAVKAEIVWALEFDMSHFSLRLSQVK